MSESRALHFYLPVEKGRAGKPRLDPYHRLLSRFYEAFILLHSLNGTRALRAPFPLSRCSEQEMRREFMRSLAFLCDGQKGKLTFTAFAVTKMGGDNDEEFVFIVASKKATQCKKMLEMSLMMLLHYAGVDEEEKAAHERRFLEKCVEHAKLRTTAYIKSLEMAIPACVNVLESQNRPLTNGEFLGWLRSLLLNHDGTSRSHLRVCKDMQCASMSASMMMRLHQEERRQQESYFARGGLPHYQGGCFARTRHAIGRLSSRVNKPLFLLQNASWMRNMLGRARVQVIPSLECIRKPEADHHTTLPRILGRMFRSSDDKELIRTQNILEDMERNSTIRPSKSYMDSYHECNPVVHSEIEVLEHFYKHELNFLDNDRYVYSSKPACFACKLYFTYHPAKMVVPESHEKVYLNWGPPLVADFRKGDRASDRHRDVMNKITQAIRTEALNQALGRHQPPGWHADSTTGVETLPSLANSPHDLAFVHPEQRHSALAAVNSSLMQRYLESLEHTEEEGHELAFQAQDKTSSNDVPRGVVNAIQHSSRDQETDDDEGGVSLNLARL